MVVEFHFCFEGCSPRPLKLFCDRVVPNSANFSNHVIEFDRSDTLVITRKIKVYSLKSLLLEANHKHGEHHVRSLEHNNAYDYYIYTSAKLRSLW